MPRGFARPQSWFSHHHSWDAGHGEDIGDLGGPRWEGVVAGKRGLAALSGGLNRGLVGTVVDGAKRDLGEYDCGLVAPAGEDRKP